MNISKENTGENTAILKLEITPADYSEPVEKQIHELKRKANIPGFRPGHVPVGLIKKMYGKAVLAEEVNKLLSDGLKKYIVDEKIDILGNPIPNTEKNNAIDFETQTSFEFYFDLGLTPQFTLELSKDLHVEYYHIVVDDKMVDSYIEETRKQFGKPVPGAPLQEGDPNEKPAETSGDDQKPEEPALEPAALDPELFKKVYPGLDIETPEDFREQVRKDAATGFFAETDKLFFTMVTDALVKKTEISMPDEFLKRWLLENHEGKFTPEEIGKNYSSFAESMKWQLIENRIIREYNISVTDEDIREYIRTYFLRQIGGGDADPEMKIRYESVVDAFMQNKEQVQRINDQLYNAKLLDLFKRAISVDTREISYDEFIKTASAMHPHAHDHDHDHEDHQDTEESK